MQFLDNCLEAFGVGRVSGLESRVYPRVGLGFGVLGFWGLGLAFQLFRVLGTLG